MVMWGHAATGKTVASKIIKKALEAEGFEVEILDNVTPVTDVVVKRLALQNHLTVSRVVG